MLKNTELVMLLSVLTITANANAEVYKSTDANGRITYTDQPTNNADKVNTKATAGINAVKPTTAKAANTQHTNTSTNSAFTATSNAFPSSKTSSTSTAASGGGASSAGGGTSASGGGVSASAAKPASTTAATATSASKAGSVSATATSKAGLVAAANAATAALAKANATSATTSTTTTSSSAAKTVAPVTAATTTTVSKAVVPVTATATTTAPVVAAAAVKPAAATTTTAVAAAATVTPVAATTTSTTATQSTTPVVKAAAVVAAVSTANVAQAVSNSSVAVSSTAPVVFNYSMSVKPGDVAGVQGANFGLDPVITLESNTGGPATQLPVFNKFENGWVSFRIPADATGALVVHVSNGSETSGPVMLNAAKAYHLDAMQIVPQGTFRVFGRNLLLAGSDPIVKVDGSTATVNKTLSDEYMLTVTAPAGLSATKSAVVTVDNGNGTGPYQLDRAIEVVTGSTGDPFALGVGWGAGFSSFSSNVVNAKTDSRLKLKAVCDGVADDTEGIRGAISIAARTGGGVVQLPTGTCRLLTSAPMPSRVVVQGMGKNNTIIKQYANSGIYFANIDLAGIRNLTIQNQPGVVNATGISHTNRIFVQNVKFDLAGSRRMSLELNNNFLVTGSDFVQPYNVGKNTAIVFNNTAGFVFKGNTVLTAFGASTFEDVHDGYIQGNKFTRDAARSSVYEGTYHSIAMDFAYRIAIVGNTFDIVNGPVTNKNRNDGETLLTEGGGARRTENLGVVSFATANTITDATNLINVTPFAAISGIPENYGVAIVGGKGAGQSRRVIAYASGKLTVDSPWDVVPDSTSRYSTFVWGLEKSVIKGNILSQNPRGIWLYKTAVREVDIIGNKITEGGGIYLKSFQSVKDKSFLPMYTIKVAQNSVSNTTRNWNSYITQVFARLDAQEFGVGSVGVEFSDNTLIANSPNIKLIYEDLAGSAEGYVNRMYVLGELGGETTQTRLLGTVIQRNTCANCGEAIKLGTGLRGTVLDKNVLK